MASDVPPEVEIVVTSPNVQLAMALVARRFFAETHYQRARDGVAIDPTAVIAKSARLGRDCIIGAGAVIGDECELGDGCIVGSNAVLEARVKLGAGTRIHPLVYIGHDCELGQNCEVHPNTTIGSEGFGYAHDEKFNHYRITHYGRVILEDDVHIGANVQIDRGTFLDSRIGRGTKIDNHCHFGHNIQIGENTLITGGFIAAGSVTIGSRCVFGGRTTVGGHLTIPDDCQIGGLTTIGKPIDKSGSYAGFPVQDLKSAMRTRASLKTVPQLVKQVRRILKHLGLESDSLDME